MRSLSLLTTLALFLIAKSVYSSSVILSADSPEVPAETKALYQAALIKVSLLRNFVDSLPFGKKLPRMMLLESLAILEKTLWSDRMIGLMSGYKGKVENENAGRRMLRIYRHETSQPFAEKINATRMKRSEDDGFPQGHTGFEDKWSELMDQDKIHFNPTTPSNPLRDLIGFIERKSCEYVQQRVNDIYKAQGGVLTSDGSINFGKWKVESRVNISYMNLMNYRNVYKNLSTIKFINKY